MCYSQRRTRPGNFRSSGDEIEAETKIIPVTCRYIKNGQRFKGETYFVSSSGNGGIKIGTVYLTFNNGRYKLEFYAEEFKMRDANRKIHNPWKYEKIGEDFVAQGIFKTYKKGGRVYLHMENDDGELFWPDVELKNENATGFATILNDMLLYSFEIQ